MTGNDDAAWVIAHPEDFTELEVALAREVLALRGTPDTLNDEADEPTYKIRRFCFNDNHPDHHRVIATGLTLDEAQAHCQDESTHGQDAERGQWFDGYDEE